MSRGNNLSYIHKLGKDPLQYNTIGNILENAAIKFPEREAIACLEQNQRLTYKELLEKADTFAAGLLNLGLEKGDRLGLWANNLVEWYIVNMACVRIGLIMVSINPNNQAPEMQHCINKVNIKAIICQYENKYQNFYDVLTEIVPELKNTAPKELCSAKVPSLKKVIIISDENLRGTYSYKDVVKLGDGNAIRVTKNTQQIKPDDPCYIQFTSGTTGLPKAAVATHFDVVNNSFLVGKRMQLDLKHHKICVQVPFFHNFGTTAAIAVALNFGCTLVAPSSVYNPRKNLIALQEEKCSVIYGTPTMYVDLINLQKDIQLDIQPEMAVTGAAPCSPELINQMREVLNMKKVKSLYGMTESGCVVFQSLPVEEDDFQITSTVGQLGDHWEAKVVDLNGYIVPFGTPGQLHVRGYGTMLEYWNDEEKTKKIMGPDGWLKTGDLFVLQEDGYGRIVGRLKNTIIRGGENIFPKEIEDFLSAHPSILEVQVIGLPHGRLGEEVCACVRLRNGKKFTYQDLTDFCKGKLAFFKIPSQLMVVEAFPTTASDKIQKYQLRVKIEELMKNSYSK